MQVQVRPILLAVFPALKLTVEPDREVLAMEITSKPGIPRNKCKLLWLNCMGSCWTAWTTSRGTVNKPVQAHWPHEISLDTMNVTLPAIARQAPFGRAPVNTASHAGHSTVKQVLEVSRIHSSRSLGSCSTPITRVCGYGRGFRSRTPSFLGRAKEVAGPLAGLGWMAGCGCGRLSETLANKA